jgi:hypothetical protein
MKTSNKIFLAAVLLLIAYLVGYDFTLKTEYEKGAYKSRFYGMTEVKLSNFNVINHNAGNMVGLHIEQGKAYGVWVEEYFKDRITISQSGQTLTIKYTGKDVRQWSDRAGIIITCPVISQVTATPFAMPKDFEEEDEFSTRGIVELEGFKQTLPLSIRSDKSISITMSKNSLSELNASVGNSPKDKPRLTIGDDNHIAAANINMQGAAQLSLYGPAIEKPNYHLGDSTMITLSGSSLKMVQPK